jgi:glutamine---fructose-6-phosphate transaminase (isomerizing)
VNIPATHMRTEILEQPAALRATLDALLPRTAEVASLAKQAHHVLFFARGTSDNAAVYGTYLLQTTTGRLASLGSPSVATTYRSRVDLSDVLAVGLSQSGRTEEIVETLAWARDCGASVVGITNGAGSPLAELADVALVTEAGTERAVPATKTFTCQLAALAILALGLGADLDRGLLRQLPDAISELLTVAIAPGYGIADVVNDLSAVEGLVVSARGLAYSAALEIALKIKEACYLHAMGISYSDLQHGPIAVVSAKTPALIIAADSGPTLKAAVGLAKRVTSAGASAYAIGGGRALAEVSTRALAGPALPEWLAPIGLVVPGQLLTEELSRRLGIDPDSPRGLSKVTQTS